MFEQGAKTVTVAEQLRIAGELQECASDGLTVNGRRDDSPAPTIGVGGNTQATGGRQPYADAKDPG